MRNKNAPAPTNLQKHRYLPALPVNNIESPSICQNGSCKAIFKDATILTPFIESALFMSRPTVQPAKKPAGIQAGTTASSDPSKNLERRVVKACQKTYQKVMPELLRILPKGYSLKFTKSFTAKELRNHLAQDGIFLAKDEELTGFRPDGGIYWIVTPAGYALPYLVVEAKYQKDKGNAIDRVFKNLISLCMVNKHASFLTFVDGTGAKKKGPIRKSLNTGFACHAKEHNQPMRLWNTNYAGGLSAHVYSTITKMEETLFDTMLMAAKHCLAQEQKLALSPNTSPLHMPWRGMTEGLAQTAADWISAKLEQFPRPRQKLPTMV